MKIHAVHLKRFRSLLDASLNGFTNFNVVIGKNNAGKSSVLTAIELAVQHLQGGRPVSEWQTRGRVADEFTNRDVTHQLQIGIEFHISEELNKKFQDQLRKETTGIDVAIQQLSSFTISSVIINGALHESYAYFYVKNLGFGHIHSEKGHLAIDGSTVLTIPDEAAAELFEREQEIKEKKEELRRLDSSSSEQFRMMEYYVREPRSKDESAVFTRRLRDTLSPSLFKRFSEASQKIVGSASIPDADQFQTMISDIAQSIQHEIQEIEEKQITTSIRSYAGTVKVMPSYVPWLMQALGDGKLLYLKEVRSAIGLDEASQLLRMKTQRGGPQRLTKLQDTVKSLLGVNLDAFEPEISETIAVRSRRTSSARLAEIDVDEFLVEANGAGIREALRIILDVELKEPSVVLVEEPEVHLHPGLEKILHSYLIDKSRVTQLFIATHSTSFIDVASEQSIYLITRKDGGSSSIEQIASENNLLRIPEEVGLKPSSVLMFDQLIFVEGPSDETLLREFGRKLGVSFAMRNITFVQMGGATRFAHFAADSTIDLLSRRQIKMWFVVDRDEKDEEDISKLLSKLGSRAQLAVFQKREIENYLLCPRAVQCVIQSKISSDKSAAIPTVEQIQQDIEEAANDLKERTISLHIIRKFLGPVYIDRESGAPADRLRTALETITNRLNNIQSESDNHSKIIEDHWSGKKKDLAPGSEILEKVFSKYSLRFRKETDGLRIAENMTVNEIDSEISSLIKKISC